MDQEREIPGSEGLREFANSHLIYEIGMFFDLADYLEQRVLDLEFGEARDKGMPARNALIEAFAIHMRALVDFFYGASTTHAKDAYARDFAPGWRPPRRTQNLNRLGTQRVGTEIAHLSYGRMEVVEQARTWPFAAIRDDMREVVIEFLRQLQPDLVGERFVAHVREILNPTPTGSALERQMDQMVAEMRASMGWQNTVAGTATQPLLPPSNLSGGSVDPATSQDA